MTTEKTTTIPVEHYLNLPIDAYKNITVSKEPQEQLTIGKALGFIKDHPYAERIVNSRLDPIKYAEHKRKYKCVTWALNNIPVRHKGQVEDTLLTGVQYMDFDAGKDFTGSSETAIEVIKAQPSTIAVWKSLSG